MKPAGTPTAPASPARSGPRTGRPARPGAVPSPALRVGGGAGAGRLRPAPPDQRDCSPDEQHADREQPAPLGVIPAGFRGHRADSLPDAEGRPPADDGGLSPPGPLRGTRGG